MKYRDAARLHNDDEVIHKETKEVCKVYEVSVFPKMIVIKLQHPTLGYMETIHTEVK
jgi:hypothetical protein